jgi:hypothetical protein
MKQFCIVIALVLGFTLGCGSDHSKSSDINGNWNATLTSAGNQTVLAFATSLKANGDSSLNISNFHFTTDSPCFVSDETESGSFTVNGDFDGNVKGKFGMTVQSGDPAGNALALSGTDDGNTISGTWTLTGGSGCTGNGTFAMTRM